MNMKDAPLFVLIAILVAGVTSASTGKLTIRF